MRVQKRDFFYMKKRMHKKLHHFFTEHFIHCYTLEEQGRKYNTMHTMCYPSQRDKRKYIPFALKLLSTYNRKVCGHTLVFYMASIFFTSFLPIYITIMVCFGYKKLNILNFSFNLVSCRGWMYLTYSPVVHVWITDVERTTRTMMAVVAQFF